MKVNLFPWIALLLMLSLSWWLRILFIEPQPLAIICESGVDDFACRLRKALTTLFYDNIIGFTVLGLAVSSILLRSGVVCLAAALLGMAGMVIHGGLHTGVEFNSLGFVIAVLSLPRLWSQTGQSNIAALTKAPPQD